MVSGLVGGAAAAVRTVGGAIEDFWTFLLNHFEHIIWTYLVFTIGLSAVYLAVKIRDLFFEDRGEGLVRLGRAVLFYGTVFGQSLLLLTIGTVSYVNIRHKPPLDDRLVIGTDTRWARDDTRIFYIAGDRLISILPDGSGRKVHFRAPGPIRAYRFSPDGRHITVLTDDELFLLRTGDDSVRLIAGWRTGNLPVGGEGTLRGMIGGVRWAPGSDRFCFRTARWTPFSSQEGWFVYDLAEGRLRPIASPTRRFPDLYWDQTGGALYLPWFGVRGPAEAANPYEVRLYRVSLDTLRPRLVLKFPFDRPELPWDHLALRGIHLYAPRGDLAFGRAGPLQWGARRIGRVGIDDDDHLYYIVNRWWKKRLYSVPRVPDAAVDADPYENGRLVVQDLRWLPSGRYVVMEHLYYGILILDPVGGRVGILGSDRGRAFGWYTPPASSRPRSVGGE